MVKITKKKPLYEAVPNYKNEKTHQIVSRFLICKLIFISGTSIATQKPLSTPTPNEIVDKKLKIYIRNWCGDKLPWGDLMYKKTATKAVVVF